MSARLDVTFASDDPDVIEQLRAALRDNAFALEPVVVMVKQPHERAATAYTVQVEDVSTS